MSDDALIRKLRAQREFWMELAPAADGRPALRVKLRRPTEWEVARDFASGTRDPMANVRDYTVDWEGFSEATLLGDAIGSSDPLPFDREVWYEASSDRAEWSQPVVAKLVEVINERAKRQQDAAKN